MWNFKFYLFLRIEKKNYCQCGILTTAISTDTCASVVNARRLRAGMIIDLSFFSMWISEKCLPRLDTG